MNGTRNKKKVNDNAIANRDNDRMLVILDQYDKMVHKFVREAATNAVCDPEDLYQEGRLAIIKAYDSYDDSKEASFNTWAYHCVKDAILEYQKQHLGFLSGGAYLYGAMKKAGKDATIEDLMELGLSKKTALVSTYFNMKPAQYGECFNMADPKQKAQLEELETFKLDYRKYLTEKEIFAIEHYFGLRYADAITMEEIGKHLGKSRKAVSYLINQAIVKLRHINGIEMYNLDD
jgi:RNA polymerase sigma factor (sigma-70 family)